MDSLGECDISYNKDFWLSMILWHVYFQKQTDATLALLSIYFTISWKITNCHNWGPGNTWACTCIIFGLHISKCDISGKCTFPLLIWWVTVTGKIIDNGVTALQILISRKNNRKFENIIRKDLLTTWKVQKLWIFLYL